MATPAVIFQDDNFLAVYSKTAEELANLLRKKRLPSSGNRLELAKRLYFAEKLNLTDYPSESELENLTKRRYQEKLTVDGKQLPDPYSVTSGWQDDVNQWPTVHSNNIYTYLLETPSVFDHEALKATKSLQGYKFYADGWIKTTLVLNIHGHNLCFLKSFVRHSMKIRDKCHDVWVLIKKDTGDVLASHCTCMAG